MTDTWGGAHDYHRLATRWPDSRARTYRLREETIAALDRLAVSHRVGVSDLVDFLLAEAVRQAETGELAIPTREAGLRVVDRRG
ncbi:MAG: hypothetical protein HPY83_08810 [Anaerolineae bacterium]|nr:hypothetical protein [Anaerolineae bacterium]